MCKQRVSPEAADGWRAAIRILGAAALLGVLNVNLAYSHAQVEAKAAGISPTALSVSVTASPAVVDGKCPAHIRFSATIVAETAGVITYRWERSDGALAPIETANISPGKNVIEGEWIVGSDAVSPFTGWQSLRVLGAVEVTSNKAAFEVLCNAPPQQLLFKVDPSLKPSVLELPQLDAQPRRVATLVGPFGTQTDFVEDELVVMIERGEVFDRFLRRSRGIVLWSLETAGLAGMPPLHLVRVETRAADVTRMEADFRSLGAQGAGDIHVSSENGMSLLAVAAAERGRRGIPLSINFLAQPTDFLTRRTAESGVGVSGWNSNAFTWPYMSRRATDPASVQDIGVGDAWRALQLAGVLGNRVSVAVLDSGFQRMPDLNFELMENPLRDLSPRAINPFICSDGNPCPWHGTNVVSALAGLADNGRGAAGSAGPVARVLAIERGGPDFFFGIANALINSVRALFAGQRVVNMSFSGSIDAVPSLLVIPVVDPLFAAARVAGTLVVASAGNAGIDVDAPGVVGEGVYTIPCESPGVMCVGGLDWNSRLIDPRSNFGSAFGTQADSVDVFGPFTVWAEEDPSDLPFTGAKMVGGTSVASPFVAGVAALIAAANPALTVGQIESVLLRTMNRGTSGEAPAWVNAFAAVTSVLGGAPPDNFPPTISILRPRDGTVVDAGRPVALIAAAADREGPVRVEWSLPDGSRPSGPSVSHAFVTRGESTVIARVTDSGGVTTSAQVTVQVINPPPAPEIQWPRDGDRILAGSGMTLRGVALDRNEGPAEYEASLPGAALVWSDDRTEVSGTGESLPAVLSIPGWHRITLTATDSFGASASVTVSVEVVADPSLVTHSVAILSPVNRATIVGDAATLRMHMQAVSSFPAGANYVWYADWVDAAGAVHTQEIGRNTLDFSWTPGSVLPRSAYVDVAIRLVAEAAGAPSVTSRVRIRVGFPPG